MDFEWCELGMVIGPHPATAEAGLEALRAGGNAFDAIVAAALTEAVVQPAHNGLAGYGGGAVCFLAAEGRVVALDFDSEAPAAARPDMFPLEPHPTEGFVVRDRLNQEGALAVGVPGVVAGLEAIHSRWARLPLAELAAPAIRAARDGWSCNRHTHEAIRGVADRLPAAFPETARLVMPDGRVPEPGETLRNPELADTLERLVRVGLRDFYEGEIAARIVAEVRARGGLLAADDLAAYRPRLLDPLSMEYRGRVLHTPPPPCGGLTTFQILRVLERFDLEERQLGSEPFFHLFGEVLKPCWRRRLRELGDPLFVGHVEERELSDPIVAELRAEVEEGLRNPQPGVRLGSDPITCTSHLCTADSAGNVVSLTQTHGGHFGSWLSVPGTGLILGHGMFRFDPRPGWPNSIAPRKRPLHNMAPIVATEAGRPVAAYGTPGGRTIVNNQAYFTLALLRCGLEPDSALSLPRLHCEEAEPLKLERRAGEAVLTALRARGHRVEVVERNGGPAHILMIGANAQRLLGATDPRGEGRVARA